MTEEIGFERRPTRAWRITLGTFVLFYSAFNSTNFYLNPATSQAQALGRLFGLLLLLMLTVWLISSGLPRSLGGAELARTRRKIWYKLVLIGLLVMITLAGLLAWLSLFTLAVLVSWLYWFGCTLAAFRSLRV